RGRLWIPSDAGDNLRYTGVPPRPPAVTHHHRVTADLLPTTSPTPWPAPSTVGTAVPRSNHERFVAVLSTLQQVLPTACGPARRDRDRSERAGCDPGAVRSAGPSGRHSTPRIRDDRRLAAE